MVKASALHLVLVITLVITVVLGSLIYLHFFYRGQQQKIDRWDALKQDMDAGTSLALSTYFPYTQQGDSLMLSPITLRDSLRIGKKQWGFLDAVTVHSWRGEDTLKRSFLSGVQPKDSTVLYIVDEDRPLSISGKTVIQGTAFLPQSGIRPAFVDGEYYQGIEEMVDGQIKESGQALPAYDTERIDVIKSRYKENLLESADIPSNGSLRHSFFETTRYYRFPVASSLFADSVSGNLVILADSSIHISAQTIWEDAIVIAPHIKLEDDFTGKGQFFAFDSLTVGKNVALRYPSVLGLLTADSLNDPLRISIGENSRIQGMVLLHRADVPDQMDLLELQKNVTVEGQLISFGLLKYTDPMTINGGVYAYRLITQRPSSLYENYLISLNLERNKLHPYYIAPFFWTTDKPAPQKIVKWLN
ncbi:hypothetical protein [Sphingobacterium haloxyli]|uniref:Uncharacterized protein n=1 Tax=Sphingobacterium haloxyli TaxID=2100533 RepID=A0A2S9J0G2_9SPHI|nr:hypothetical protein [Sphingobacterium haloxyli]PRD46267.1 hypothetical protein C5745_15885 [Sphingobacterium haloxyli]